MMNIILSKVNNMLKDFDIQIICDKCSAKPDPKPEPKPDPKPEPELIPLSRHYSHYNPISWDGKGVSIIFCPDSPQWETVELNGQKLRCHTRNDRGRQIWTNYDFVHKAPTRVSGTIICRRGNLAIRIEVTGEGTYLDHKGDCFRVYGD